MYKDGWFDFPNFCNFFLGVSLAAESKSGGLGGIGYRKFKMVGQF